ncbi:MAG TPA: ATP-binding cassette domain-containing protein [Chromatiales bacterium]|nr:ATP-binding cassette domain-containing protein [Thiotrichales bacterium]HIP69189.1 ATP-binding cassette domain-containing protein [Chromatiales bacterium]
MLAGQPLFQVKNLTTLLGSEVFDFSLHPHEVLAISGPSGSGKSLLLRALADLDKHQGQVFLKGRSQATFKPAEWRRQIVLVAAESAWWSSTVADHFQKLPTEQSLSELGFSADVLRWPVNRLSSGERQRLGLLRALVLKPTILLLDEPTANLDEKNTLKVEKLIKDYLKNNPAAAIWVSHNSTQRKRLNSKELVLA